jgi:hypothetical protein
MNMRVLDGVAAVAADALTMGISMIPTRAASNATAGRDRADRNRVTFGVSMSILPICA